jgi:hypothetical protein
MNNIHRDKTKYNPNDAGNWVNKMYQDDATVNRNEENANKRANWWKSQLSKPDLKPAEKKELELMQRIAGCTEGDSLAKRVDTAKKEFQVGRALAEDQTKQTRGQSVEEFEIEQSKWSGSYARKVEAARKKFGL